MSTIEQLETILARLENCPLNLVRVELEIFQNTLRSDAHLTTVLEEIVRSNEVVLGAKISTLVGNIGSSIWTALSFANTEPLKAATGYLLCVNLLGERDSIKCGRNVFQIGAHYGAYLGSRDTSPAHAIKVFSEIFLRPLVSYLHCGLELQHQILQLLSRYKQRSEWFPEEDLAQAASSTKGELEKKLKRDFLRYLFDNGIDFSVESEVPPGGGEVDVLPIVPGMGFLPIEVKVFDGQNRGAPHITKGLAQTCDYARKFNSPRACYVIYNVAENTVLSLPGTPTGPNVISVQINEVTIFSIIANLCIILRASEAKNLRTVDIPLPTSNKY